MSKIDQEIIDRGGEVKDNYLEHPIHFKHDPHCSECFKRGGVEVTNAKQGDNLFKLRESIRMQREERVRGLELQPQINIPLKKLELKPVPEITVEDKTEFSLERHTQLCGRADILYHNYLYWKEKMYIKGQFIELSNKNFDGFETAIKDLCVGIDEVVNESIKVRFS